MAADNGAIVATRKPFDIETPLLLTHFFREYWQNANWDQYKMTLGTQYLPKVHIAIHYGDCRWLQSHTLRSPLYESANCFGVNVNILSRIAVFSTEKGDYVSSQDYSKRILDNGASTYKIELPNETWTSVIFDHLETEKIRNKGNQEYNFRKFKFS